MKRRGIGSHTKPNGGQEELWLTPMPLLSVLGEFDLDPCACPEPRPWPTAKHHVALPDNGLAAQWFGRVWLNPPYGRNIGIWMERMADHRRGIALTFARTETEFWTRWIWPYADSILFIFGRLYFHNPNGERAKGNSGGPSALIAYSQEDTKILQASGIRGAHVKLIQEAR